MNAAFQNKGLVRCPSDLITSQYSFIQNQKSCRKLENTIILYLCFLANQGSLVFFLIDINIFIDPHMLLK